MKFKFAVFTLSLLMVLTMSTGAFAQTVGIFTLSNGSEARARDNGHAEKVGDITFFLTTGFLGELHWRSIINNDEVSGTIKIDYGVPITNGFGAVSTAAAPNNNIAVNVCGDPLIAAPIEGADEDANAVSMSSNDETITIYVEKCDGPGKRQINVGNVLVSLDGSGASSVTATITATGAVRLPGGSGNSLTLVDSVVDPLIDDNVAVGQTLELIRHTGKPADESVFKLVITEAHNDSFDDAQLELKFSGIPEGIDIVGLDAWVTTKKKFDADPDATNAVGNQVPVTMEGAVDDQIFQ